MPSRLQCLTLLLACAACDPSAKDGADAATTLCTGTPSGGCETVVGSADQCPDPGAICAGLCNAAYDCCYCGEDSYSGAWAWQTLYIDCPACDAGPDAPGADAGDAGGTLDAAGPDAPTCAGTPGGGCELVVGGVDECPSASSVCAGVCDATYDCCYCGGDGTWQTLYVDCSPCDAGTFGP